MNKFIKLVEISEDKDVTSQGLQGLEGLFLTSWEGWDQLDSGTFYFYDPVIKHDLKDLKAGTKIEGFLLDTEKSLIEFCISENVIYTFKLVLE